MSIDVITMEDCASNYGIFQVESSKPNDPHYVTFYGSESQAHCTCLSYKYSKSLNKQCKHLALVFETACMYNPQWHDGNANPQLRPTGYTYDRFSGNTCKCGGPLVWVKRAV